MHIKTLITLKNLKLNLPIFFFLGLSSYGQKNTKDTVWKSYTAKTIDKLPKFKIKKDPKTNVYGSWKVSASEATGFFRAEKKENRWWIIDPEGYPFIHKAVAVYRPGSSDNQKAALLKTYKTDENWVLEETKFLKEQGFNGAGSWSAVDLMRETKAPLVYSVIVNPMGSYKREHRRKFGKYKQAGWQGYRFDLAMVFDPEFDAHVEKEISKIEKYKNDKFLLGYYTDNELPWVDDALDRHLNLLAKDEAGYLAARKWLDKRKGKDATLADITDEDREAFTGFYFETYIKKVSEAVKKYDPNHMYLGCRFNQERDELDNPTIFKVAGKYMHIISINHYRKWEPIQSILNDWETWSGKPFLITEWYTKGEDSGLPNDTGAGWNVPTQKDRGYFYQNFTIELLKSKACVGWHWFTYQDNDPNNLKTDPSNRNSNKGIVDNDFNHYMPLIDYMKAINNHTFQLIKYFDKQKN